MRSTIVRIMLLNFFFFSSRRRHTRFKCDWSSDVCSSDLEVVERGMAEGKLRAPTSRRRWRGNPALPEWVIATGRLPAEPATLPGRDYFWRPELQWASDLRLRIEDLARLKRVNVLLRDMPANEPNIPMRERSLEIFGDEKLLDELTSSSRLVGKDRLTLDLLRARAVHPPFFHTLLSPPAC